MGTPLLIHQPSYSILERWIEDGLLDVLGREGVGCIAFSALAQGVLTGKYLDGIPAGSRASQADGTLAAEEISEQRLGRVRALNDVARARGQSLAQLALSWVLRDPADDLGRDRRQQRRAAGGEPGRGGPDHVHRGRAGGDRRGADWLGPVRSVRGSVIVNLVSPRPAGHGRVTAVRGGHGLHDRQAEPAAARGAGPGAVAADEPLEDVGLQLRRDARPVVGHRDDRRGRRRPDGHGDGAVPAGVCRAALLSRFASTWCSRCSSPGTMTGSSGSSSCQRCDGAAAWRRC